MASSICVRSWQADNLGYRKRITFPSAVSGHVPRGQLVLGVALIPQQKLCFCEIMSSLKCCVLLVVQRSLDLQETHCTHMDGFSMQEESRQGPSDRRSLTPGGISFL